MAARMYEDILQVREDNVVALWLCTHLLFALVYHARC